MDAYDESEHVTGLYTMLEEHLEVPFRTRVLGVEVVVERIDLDDAGQIVAVCANGGVRQRIGLLDLPVPAPPPGGAEWIAAYRRWARAAWAGSLARGRFAIDPVKRALENRERVGR